MIYETLFWCYFITIFDKLVNKLEAEKLAQGDVFEQVVAVLVEKIGSYAIEYLLRIGHYNINLSEICDRELNRQVWRKLKKR